MVRCSSARRTRLAIRARRARHGGCSSRPMAPNTSVHTTPVFRRSETSASWPTDGGSRASDALSSLVSRSRGSRRGLIRHRGRGHDRGWNHAGLPSPPDRWRSRAAAMALAFDRSVWNLAHRSVDQRRSGPRATRVANLGVVGRAKRTVSQSPICRLHSAFRRNHTPR